MEITNIHEAKSTLSKLLQKVLEGEEVIIAKAGMPIARLVPYEEKRERKRVPGCLNGKIKISEDFDSMPEEQINSFYNTEKE